MGWNSLNMHQDSKGGWGWGRWWVVEGKQNDRNCTWEMKYLRKECLIMDLRIGRNLQSRLDLLSNILQMSRHTNKDGDDDEDGDNWQGHGLYLGKLTILVSTMPLGRSVEICGRGFIPNQGKPTSTSDNPNWGEWVDKLQRRRERTKIEIWSGMY